MNDWPTGIYTWEDGDTLKVCVPFTWNLPEAKALCLQREMWGPRTVHVGGPAIRLMPDYLPQVDGVTIGGDEPGVLQRLNKWATRTTVGCPNRCGFCTVPDVEGAFAELPDWPDLPIVCDNNLLRASQGHFDRVCDRLEQHLWSDFNQGLDARLLTEYHAERLARLPKCMMRLALDDSAPNSFAAWDAAYARLRSHGVPKSRIRSYVLIGYKSGVADAWKRTEFVREQGIKPLPQWYHPKDALTWNQVLPCHAQYGWTEADRTRIMGYYYRHRGEPILTLTTGGDR